MKTANEIRKMRSELIKMKEEERRKKDEETIKQREEERKHQLEHLMPVMLDKIEKQICDFVKISSEANGMNINLEDCLILDDVIGRLRELGYSVNMTQDVGNYRTQHLLHVEWNFP